MRNCSIWRCGIRIVIWKVVRRTHTSGTVTISLVGILLLNRQKFVIGTILKHKMLKRIHTISDMTHFALPIVREVVNIVYFMQSLAKELVFKTYKQLLCKVFFRDRRIYYDIVPLFLFRISKFCVFQTSIETRYKLLYIAPEYDFCTITDVLIGNRHRINVVFLDGINHVYIFKHVSFVQERNFMLISGIVTIF